MLSITKQEVITNPRLMSKFLTQESSSQNTDPKDMSVFAKIEFSDTWSESKIQKLVKKEFKSDRHRKNAQKRQYQKLTKKQWLKKNGRGLIFGLKNGWIEFSEDIADPIKHVEAYVGKN